MKRRIFLQLLSGFLAAPLIPKIAKTDPIEMASISWDVAESISVMGCILYDEKNKQVVDTGEWTDLGNGIYEAKIGANPETKDGDILTLHGGYITIT